MHYGDKPQAENNVLKVGIYVHGTSIKNVYDLELASVQECKYIYPGTLRKFLTVPEHYIDHIELLNSGKIEPEKWYILALREVDSITEPILEIVSITDVTEEPDEYIHIDERNGYATNFNKLH